MKNWEKSGANNSNVFYKVKKLKPKLDPSTLNQPRAVHLKTPRSPNDLESTIKAVETLRTISNVLSKMTQNSKKRINTQGINQNSGDIQNSAHNDSIEGSLTGKT